MRGGRTGKVSLTLTFTATKHFFSRIVCWNLFLGKLYFCKFSLMREYLPRAASSSIFPGCTERGLGRFSGCPAPQPISRSVCLLLNPQVGTTHPRFLGNMVLDPTTPTEALMFMDGIFHCLKVKVLISQLCLTLCYAMDYSPQVSSVQGILR